MPHYKPLFLRIRKFARVTAGFHSSFSGIKIVTFSSESSLDYYIKMRVLQNVKFQQDTVSVHLDDTNILCEKFILQHPQILFSHRLYVYI